MGRKHKRRSRKNRRHSRKNPNYVILKPNRKGSRKGRLRRNFFKLYGKDVVTDIAMPAGWATAGFLLANGLSNAAANMDGVRNVLNAGQTADQALATKSVANGVALAAALGIATWANKEGHKNIVTDNTAPILTGMGLALIARLLRGTALSPYLGRLGEYVDQPMSGFGEYVDQPMSGLGAYVNDPSHGTGGMGAETYYAAAGMGQTFYAAAGYQEGIDPANQEGIDGLMDVMEAAAGTHEAAAGVGEYVDQPMSGLGDTYYAAAGLGDEADSTLSKFYAKNQPPWVSIQTPTDGAVQVTKVMPRDVAIPTSLVTPEGKGFAGGLFARNLFAGMF